MTLKQLQRETPVPTALFFTKFCEKLGIQIVVYSCDSDPSTAERTDCYGQSGPDYHILNIIESGKWGFITSPQKFFGFHFCGGCGREFGDRPDNLERHERTCNQNQKIYTTVDGMYKPVENPFEYIENHCGISIEADELKKLYKNYVCIFDTETNVCNKDNDYYLFSDGVTFYGTHNLSLIACTSNVPGKNCL